MPADLHARGLAVSLSFSPICTAWILGSQAQAAQPDVALARSARCSSLWPVPFTGAEIAIMYPHCFAVRSLLVAQILAMWCRCTALSAGTWSVDTKVVQVVFRRGRGAQKGR